VVPCYNEASRLDASAFQEFIQEFDDTSIVFVDDGSSDDTQRVLHRIDPSRMFVLALSVNSGKAEAVRRGVLWGRQLKSDYIGYLDADLATPLPVVMQFRDVLDRCQKVEVVLGTRHSLSGHDIDRTWPRRLMSRVFATIAAAAVRVRVHDTQCGAKLFRNGGLLNAVFASPFGSRWIFDVEVLARVRAVLPLHSNSALREAIYELPLDQWREQAGSKLKSSDYLRAISELSSIFAQYTLWNSTNWRVVDGTAASEEEACAQVVPFAQSGDALESDVTDERRNAA
jgi:glycosyltransferase involved in cell wall biosynthesis